MAGLDDDYFQEELQRRLSQIGSLRDELWDLRDRADDAVNRTTTLQQNITRLRAEVGIRRAKANELEDKAALEQAKADEISRRIATEASAGVAEVASLQQRMAELDQAYLTIQAESEETQQLLVQKRAEVGALKAVLEARTRDAERARSELAQDEAKEEARQQRELEHTQEQEAAKVKDAESLLAVASSASTTANTELARLRRSVASERECTGSLEKALKHTIDQHKVALEEAGALEKELGGIAEQAEENNLADELAATRQKVQYLQQDLANAKRHAVMQTQSLQGALEETRRMMKDHLDQTRQHLTQTSSLNDSSLAVLLTSLADARSAADASAAGLVQLKHDKVALEEDVRKTEEAVAAEKEKAGLERAGRIEEELVAARQALDAGSRRVGVAVEDARKADAAVVEAERSATDQEELFRSKLEELWRMLRMYQPGRPGERSFQPPLRTNSGLNQTSRSNSKVRAALSGRDMEVRPTLSGRDMEVRPTLSGRDMDMTRTLSGRDMDVRSTLSGRDMEVRSMLSGNASRTTSPTRSKLPTSPTRNRLPPSRSNSGLGGLL